jgi:hypothetical protein
MPWRLPVALLIAICCFPAGARADWLITPFLGGSFAPETTLLIFERGAGRKMTLGGSVALLTDGLFGVEADFGHTPGFFEGDDPRGLVLTSRVTTLTANLIVAAPLALTRESLRPYFAGGVGLIQARSKHAGGLFPVDGNFSGLDIGGGAVGLLTPRTGLRFDLRHFKAISGEDGPFPRPGVSRLSFWRATVGLVIVGSP